MVPFRIGHRQSWSKNLNDRATGPRNKFDDIFSSVNTMHQRDRHRGRQQRQRLRIASRAIKTVLRVVRSRTRAQWHQLLGLYGTVKSELAYAISFGNSLQQTYYVYPRRRLCTAARILRSFCHDVCGYVCAWVCMLAL